jgi:pimeloyl-ACP methyl ester carboxylesterase
MEIIMIKIPQFNSIAVIIALTCVLIFAMIGNYYPDLFLIYAQQTTDLDNTSTSTINLDNIPSKHVKVGDIDISYKTFGKGDPILLITGYSGSMYSWDPIFLKGLSANHTVIVFDNRGIGNTTIGSKNFTIDQFAADSVGLLDALKINNSDILGFSMGGMIAQQLTLDYPDKVDDLIIYASNCGGNQSIPPNQQMVEQFTDLSGSPEDIKKRFIPLLFTENWIKQNSNYMEKFASVKFPPVDILQKQFDAIFSWKGTCDQLDQISQDTLVVTGTDDLVLPSANSLMMAENIPGAWLTQFKDGGHALMFQYPEKLSAIVNTFLNN